RNVKVGNLPTSRKSPLFKCASRCASWVSIEAASIVASTEEFAGFAESMWWWPGTGLNRDNALILNNLLILFDAQNAAAAGNAVLKYVLGTRDSIVLQQSSPFHL